MRFSVTDASRCLTQLIRSAQAGEEVVIVEDGEPIARLVPASRPVTDGTEVGRASTILAWLAQHPLPNASCRSAEEIDAAIEAERNAWE